jgi:AraC-like DNA-binding protein
MREGTGPSASVDAGDVRGSIPGSKSQNFPLEAHRHGCRHRKLLAFRCRAVASIEMTFDQITCRRDLESLMTDLEVSAVRLTECSVSTGWQLAFAATDVPTIIYICSGAGRVTIDDGAPIPFGRHMLIVAPPHAAIRVDVPDDRGGGVTPRVMHINWRSYHTTRARQRLEAGSDESAALLICGCFRASFGVSIDPFAGLSCAIVEQFNGTVEFECRLKAVLAELDAQQVGMRAMIAALLKQVLIALLRRSSSSTDRWPGWFVMLRDPQIARAFAEMCSRPGAPHSVHTLSRTAGLSRSVFMMRFASSFGISPAAALRQLRMRFAAKMMSRGGLSIKQLAHAAGYGSPSSFVRAFRQTYGHAPMDHHAMMLEFPKHETWPPEPRVAQRRAAQQDESLRSAAREHCGTNLTLTP